MLCPKRGYVDNTTVDPAVNFDDTPIAIGVCCTIVKIYYKVDS